MIPSDTISDDGEGGEDAAQADPTPETVEADPAPETDAAAEPASDEPAGTDT